MEAKPGGGPAQLFRRGLRVRCLAGLLLAACALLAQVSGASGATWTQQSPSSSPTARTGMGFAYDAAAGLDVGFGGQSQGTLAFQNGTETLIDPGPWRVSCPTTSFCALVDNGGHVMTYDGTSWSSLRRIDTTQIFGVSCPTTTFCMATDDSGNAMTYNGSVWSQPSATGTGNGTYGVSCTSSTFCVVADAGGNVAIYNGTSWSAANAIDSGNVLAAVSCVSISFCMAVDTAGNAFKYNGATWSSSLTGAGSLAGISCVSTSFCIAVDQSGNVEKYNGSSWTAKSIDPGYGLDDISCTSTSFCVAVDDNGYGLTYNGTSWSALVEITNAPARGVSCASTTFCISDDELGDVASYNGTSWSYSPIEGSATLKGVSCATASFCEAVDGWGHTLSWNGVDWSLSTSLNDTTYAFYNLVGVSCPSTSFCMVVGTGGDAWTFNGTAWSSRDHVTSNVFAAVSCSSSTACIAVDTGGNAWSYDGSAWTGPTVIDSGGTPTSVSCPTSSFCVAVDKSGQAMKYNGSSWSRSTIASGKDLTSVSCPTSSFCAAVDTSGEALLYSGSSWGSASSIDAGTSIGTVSCASSSFCVAGDANENGVIYNGSSWTFKTINNRGVSLVGGSCPTTSFCALVDSFNGADMYEATPTYDADTWTYNGSTDAWTSKAPASAPTGRSGAALAYDSATHQVVLFGGSSGSTYDSDTWVYDEATNTWTQESPPTHPSARDHAQMTYDAKLGLILLEGGNDNGTSFDDTWTYDPGTDTWTQLTPSGSAPAVAGATMAYVAGAGKDILFGGDPGGGASYSGSTYAYNPSTNTWGTLSTSTVPAARAYGAGAASAQQLLLFGGAQSGGDVADTWTYYPDNWTQQSPTSSPSARDGAAMVYDSTANEFVLFGGESGQTLYSDTWTGSFTSLSLEFGPTLSWMTTLTGYSVSVDDPATMTVTDTDTAGWNVQVSATALTSGAHTLPALIVNGSSSSATASTAPTTSCVYLTECAEPTGNTAVYPLSVPTATPAVLYSANSPSGTDGINLALDWWASVPASSYSGTYTGTVTVSVTSGP